MDNIRCPVFSSCHHNPTSAAKLIYFCRQHPLKFEVALETELVVAFLFSESEVIDTLYVW